MSIQSVISRIKKATGPARSLDASIAELIGWEKRVKSGTDPKTGEVKNVTLWIVPSGDDVGRVPHYTSDLQAAYQLAKDKVPDHVAGCSWENGKGSARINDGPIVEAATPQMALCIAVLMRMQTDGTH